MTCRLAVISLCGMLVAASTASAAVTAGSLESHSNVSSTKVTTSDEHARIGCSHVLVINRSAHPLLKKVLRQLRPQLETSGLAEKWEFIESSQAGGASVPASRAERAPDLFIVIDLPEINEKGLFSRSIEAKVRARLATAPYRNVHSRSSSSDPPLVQLGFDMTVDHKSTRKGYESEKDGMVSKGIANELAKGLTNVIKDTIAEHEALPALPDYLYGKYKAPPRFDFLAHAEPEFFYAGLFKHNETFWTFNVPSNFVPRLVAIKEILTGDGWRSDSSELTNTAPPDLYFTKGDSFLEIFPPAAGSEFLGQKTPAKSLVLRYCERFSKDEREQALSKLLDEKASPETLLMFERGFGSAQRKHLYERLKDSRMGSPAGYLAVADYYVRKKDTNTARAMLLRAEASQLTLQRKPKLADEIQEAWKKIAGKEKLEVTASTLREAGFTELTDQPIAVTQRVGDPLLLFIEPDGKVQTIALQIRVPRHGSTNQTHTIEIYETRGGGSTHQKEDWNFTRNPRWQRHATYATKPLRFTATPSGTNSFRLEVTPSQAK